MDVLITGGAGFIGSNLAEKLILLGHSVTVVDNFSSQVHAKNAPVSEKSNSEIIKCCVTDPIAMRDVVSDADVIVHLAAETGTGQSMYRLMHYSKTNVLGTANIFEIIGRAKNIRLKKFLLASSRSIYGEGSYFCESHGIVTGRPRQRDDLVSKKYEPRCSQCENFVTAVATNETSLLSPLSHYAAQKLHQEQIGKIACDAFGVPFIPLRLQNVYGPGQSLTNPYTGILSIFSALLKNAQPVNIFEDGFESRDFVYISDVVDAFVTCIENEIPPQPYNIGSGVATTVIDVAENLQKLFGTNSQLNVTHEFRLGDIRHNFADIRRAAQHLGFSPKVGLQDGLSLLSKWVDRQPIRDTHSPLNESFQELRKSGHLLQAKL